MWAAVMVHGGWVNGRRTPTYVTWANMIARCTNPRAARYERYGGRGISVCDRWRSFSAFLEDMGDRPSPAHSIDRVDNDGNYEPGNCRWATRAEQARNKPSTRVVRAHGESMTISEWAARTGISAANIAFRLEHGWTHEEAVSTATGSASQSRLGAEQIAAIRCATGTHREIALRYGVSQSHVTRIRNREACRGVA